MTILVTGSAGFIGFHLTKKLLKEGFEVVGIDNLNSYYDVSLKNERLKELKKFSKDIPIKFQFFKEDITNKIFLDDLFKKFKFKKVVNLAAQAGVRYSLKNPSSYINSNILGFANILESCRNYDVEHLIYASSSSVYGGNKNMPFSENQNVDYPISLYAASKKSNELMAHTYSHLYAIPTTGLRFFTVYGPWGRPDMALFLFTKSIIEKNPIKVFNNGEMTRDFTYIDDIIESLFRVIKKIPKPEMDLDNRSEVPSTAPYRIFNIGNSNPIKLMEFISEIENSLGIKAKKEFLEMQPGDVANTFADTTALEKWINFKPNTSVKDGITEFIKWYKKFFNH
ncbi:NAD-dependent epimerase [Prochlorococcus sp. AH-716-P20]|nr:NAD-dependent epimerase [Prochlorococcus sp. AH-716-P20]